MHKKHIVRETCLEFPQGYMMELFFSEELIILSLMLFSQKKNFIMFGIVLNTPLSYRESIWYYSTDDTRAFLAQRSKPTTKLTSKVTNKRLSTWLFSSMLLTVLLEHLERKIFRLLQIIPIVTGRGLEKSWRWKNY